MSRPPESSDELDRTVATLDKGLQLVTARHEGGIASRLDVAQEETLLRTTQTQATLLHQQRDQDDEDEPDAHHAYACLSTMDSIVSATSSQPSMAASS